jgi:hypothetical protein
VWPPLMLREVYMQPAGRHVHLEIAVLARWLAS